LRKCHNAFRLRASPFHAGMKEDVQPKKEAEMPHEWVNYKSLRAELSSIEILHYYGVELKGGEQWQGFCPHTCTARPARGRSSSVMVNASTRFADGYQIRSRRRGADQRRQTACAQGLVRPRNPADARNNLPNPHGCNRTKGWPRKDTRRRTDRPAVSAVPLAPAVPRTNVRGVH
jgi:hypothetical protein